LTVIAMASLDHVNNKGISTDPESGGMSRRQKGIFVIE